MGYTTKVDLYSLGMTLANVVVTSLRVDGHAVVNGDVYGMGDRGALVADAVTRLSVGCAGLADLVRACCAAVPEDRPDAAAALLRVREIQAERLHA